MCELRPMCRSVSHRRAHRESEIEAVWNALSDPSKVVVAQIAPAVRVAVGEAFGKKPGELETGKIVAALKKIGFAKGF